MKFIRNSILFENKEKIILRDYLAIERTYLANERTLMAYIRTALYLILAGIAFIQVQGLGNLVWLGIASLVAGLLFFLVGIFRYRTIIHRLKVYYSRQKGSSSENQEPELQ